MIQKKFYLLTWLCTVIISLVVALILFSISSFTASDALGWKRFDFFELVLLCTIPGALPGTLFFIIVTWNFQFWLLRPNHYFYVKIVGGLAVLFNFLLAGSLLNMRMQDKGFWNLGVIALASMLLPLSITKRYFLKKENTPYQL